MAWVSFFKANILGKAEPAGSKRSLVPVNKHTRKPFINPKTGGIVVSTVDSNPKASGWKQRVSQHVSDRYRGELETGPLFLRLTFFQTRPANHFGTGKNAGKLKSSAASFPTPKPDCLKLARAVEDALTKVVWKDDSQIVSEVIHKLYGSRAGVRLEIFRWQ